MSVIACRATRTVAATPPVLVFGLIIAVACPTRGGRCLAADTSDIAVHQRAPLTTEEVSAAQSINAFAFDLLAQIAGERKWSENTLFSPFSISSALGMTYAGARGTTATDMARVLHYQSDGIHQGMGDLTTDLDTPQAAYDFRVANRIFGQKDFMFKAEFLELLQDIYTAPMESMDFRSAPEESRQYINRWVEEQTNDRIQELLPKGVVGETTQFVLTNAVYFDGQWQYSFNEKLTQDAPFYLDATTTIEIPMMRQTNTVRYGRFDSYQMVELPYAGGDLSMVAMLPNDVDGLADLESSLTAETFQQSLYELRPTDVVVELPKFRFDDEQSLENSLADLGMGIAFDKNEADFGDMAYLAANENLYLTHVLHKAFIDVNESGTEAAAVTTVVGALDTTAFGSPPPPLPVFRADHPFLFGVRDNHSGAMLFLGRLADPDSNAARTYLVPESSGWGVMFIMFLFRRRRTTRHENAFL
ncbi:MAG: serpin family protein [Pirellulaceae bacterium]|nr:serpin family protein [Planctomycetales bacterium]